MCHECLSIEPIHTNLVGISQYSIWNSMQHLPHTPYDGQDIPQLEYTNPSVNSRLNWNFVQSNLHIALLLSYSPFYTVTLPILHLSRPKYSTLLFLSPTEDSNWSRDASQHRPKAIKMEPFWTIYYSFSRSPAHIHTYNHLHANIKCNISWAQLCTSCLFTPTAV